MDIPINLTAVNPGDFSFSEAVSVIIPLLMYIAGIVVYAVFIFKFYKFVARKDIIRLNLRQYSESFMGFVEAFLSGVLYVIEYLLLFPLLAFFWFAVMSGLLLLLSKNSPDVILLLSMALVSSVRVTAYYNEDLSRDLAKMIPFALLGVFLVDMSFSLLQKCLRWVKASCLCGRPQYII